MNKKKLNNDRVKAGKKGGFYRGGRKPMKFLRHKAVLALYTLSLILDVSARKLAGKENDNTEYYVKFLHYDCWYC